MSVTTAIENISNHLKNAYDELQGLGADLTNINKNIENISMVLDDIYDSMPQTSGEGTSLTLDDTRVGKIKSTLKGNTSQDGTPTPASPIPVNVVSGDNEINICGKNLAKVNYEYNQTTNGVTCKVNQDGSITLNGTASNNTNFIISTGLGLPNGTYSISVSGLPTDSDKARIRFRNANGSYSDGATSAELLYNRTSYSFTNRDVNNFEILVLNGATVNATLKVQLEKDSSVTNFEPYTNDIYNVNLPVENLFDKTNDIVEGYTFGTNGELIRNSDFFYQNYYIPVTPNTIYSITKPTIGTSLRVLEYKSDKTFIQRDYEQYTITTTANTHFIRVSNYKSALDTLQIEKGSKINSYTPYETTPIELCSNQDGTKRDYFLHDKALDKWYLHKEISKVVLDSNKNWNYISVAQGSLFRSDNSILDAIINTTVVPYSNYYRGIPLSQSINRINNDLYINNATNYSYIDIIDNRYTNATDFKNELSNNNVVLYYVPTTPTNEEITYQPLIDQLNELEKAMSKDGQTNISQKNDNLPFIINATALMKNSD